MYDYEIKRVKANDLETILEGLVKWEVLAIVPTGANVTAPITGEYFLVIARRFKP
jgi:hypothetical protein